MPEIGQIGIADNERAFLILVDKTVYCIDRVQVEYQPKISNFYQNDEYGDIPLDAIYGSCGITVKGQMIPGVFQPDHVRLALAVLEGDRNTAYLLADLVQERHVGAVVEKPKAPPLYLFVWRHVLDHYNYGMAFAVAPNRTWAESLLLEQRERDGYDTERFAQELAAEIPEQAEIGPGAKACGWMSRLE